MQPHVNGSAEYLNYLRELVQSFEIIRSKISDVSNGNAGDKFLN